MVEFRSCGIQCGIPVAVQPRPGVHVPSALSHLNRRLPVRVTHDQRMRPRIIPEALGRPAELAFRRGSNRLGMSLPVGQIMAHFIREPKPPIGMQESIEGDNRGGGGEPMHPESSRALFMEAVSVDHPNRTGRRGNCQLVGRELYSCIGFPERVAPAIVIAPNHGDRDSPSHGGQGGRNAEAPTRDQPTIAEPVIEKVAGKEEGVPGPWHLVKEVQEGQLIGWGGSSEVGVGHDDKSGIFHGSKGAE